jgi:GT2 family glycosyltransferase
MKINLVVLAKESRKISWNLGEIYISNDSPNDINNVLFANIKEPTADYWLIWDEQLGNPNERTIISIIQKPGDVWHAGLNLGMIGQPEILNFVSPNWPLLVDPDQNNESSSWRLSVRCCLIKKEILQQLGGLSETFDSLDAASLELGYRWIKSGVFIRFIPDMCTLKKESNTLFSYSDQMRFLCLHFPLRWRLWSWARCFFTGKFGWSEGIRIYKKIIKKVTISKNVVYKHPESISDNDLSNAAVTVLIPTFQRYSYLNILLAQLEKQSIRPQEVIVVDQTALDERNQIDLEEINLPLKILYLDNPGQCSARNLGLRSASGEYILFLDDDTEIPNDLIESHLRSLASFKANVSCGVVQEDEIEVIPEDFSFIRISDVFTTANGMIRKPILQKTGLFDIAFDCKTNEDGELFLRMFLSGEMVILNPEISIIHHHAAHGGLRAHGQRKITFSGSRSRLFQRRLMNESECYIGMRYFNLAQLHESILLSILGTFSIRGNLIRKLLKFFVSFLYLPNSILSLENAYERAKKKLANGFPKIPKY